MAQIPPLTPGKLEEWLLCGAAVMAIISLARQLFVRKPPIEAEFVSRHEFDLFRGAVERQVDSLRDKIDARFLTLTGKIEELKADLLAASQRQGTSLHRRINEMEADSRGWMRERAQSPESKVRSHSSHSSQTSHCPYENSL